MSLMAGCSCSHFWFTERKFLVCFQAWMIGLSLSMQAQESGRDLNLRLTAAAGYSVENLDWSIAGKNTSGEAVNILSELKWKKSGGIHLYLNGEWQAWKGLFVRSDLSRTFIASGKVSDTDFSKSNRQDTSFHDVFNSDKGAVVCYSAAVGYAINFLKKHTIAPFAGYRHDSQSLYMLRDNANVQGDLKSTYQTKWNGPFTGLDLKVRVSKKLAARGRITYHQVRYSAKANWNLIEDFKHPVSFEHHAKGYGLATDAGLEYLAGKKISAMLRVAYGSWTTGKGTDTLYRTNGDIVVTQLNSVHRNNLTLSAGVQMTFN